MRAADRGLATGLFIFVAGLTVAALLYIMLDPAMESAINLSTSRNPPARASDAIALRQRIWANILFVPLGLGLLYVIARAVFESRRPG